VSATFKQSLASTSPVSGEDSVAYILVKAAPGVKPADLKKRLGEKLSDVDVYTTAEFSRRTRFYWMFTTGAGLAVLTAALMGLVVGVAVGGPTSFAAALGHIPRDGTRQNPGAATRYLLPP